tara:strand:+ start:439 stop:876 length:438 start_codon:yes stop_codon:yes gene_type:complete
MIEKLCSNIIEDELSGYVDTLLRAEETLQALNRLDIHSPNDIQGVVLPPSFSDASIRNVLSGFGKQFYSSVGHKILTERSDWGNRGDGFEVIVSTTRLKIVFDTSTETITGYWNGHSHSQAMPESICEDLVDALLSTYGQSSTYR